MTVPTTRIWSWQDPPGGWIEQGPGDQSDIDRRYGTARQHAINGAAFVLRPAGQRPTGHPAELGVPVVQVDPTPAPPEKREPVVVLATPFELLRVASGHSMRFTTQDGQLVELRLPTREEYAAAVERAHAELRAMGGEPPPMPSTVVIDRLIAPVPL